MAPSSKYVGSGSHPADPSDSEAGSVERTAARGPWQVLKETSRSATPVIAPTSHGEIRENEGIRAEDVPRCPLCGGEGATVYRDLRDRHWAVHGAWSLRRCGACRFAWLNPRPLPEEMPNLYRGYFTHRAPPIQPRVEDEGILRRWQRAVLSELGYEIGGQPGVGGLADQALRFLPWVREEYQRFVYYVPGPPRGTLLDVGCGDGAFLDRMHDLGWRVRGLEPDPEAAAVARGRHGLDVTEGSIEDANLPPEAFHAITMNHVIEHVRDPVLALMKCRRALEPDGILVLITPNIDSWGHRNFGQSWWGLDPPRHLYLFSRTTLLNALGAAGLTAQSTRTSALRAYWYHRSSSAIRATGRADISKGFSKLSFSDHAFRYAEYAMTHVRPDAGEELVVVARNPQGAKAR